MFIKPKIFVIKKKKILTVNYKPKLLQDTKIYLIFYILPLELATQIIII